MQRKQLQCNIIEIENERSDFSERFAYGATDSFPRSWFIMVTLSTILHGHGILAKIMVRSWQDHDKILTRDASNWPWIMPRVTWLRTLGLQGKTRSKHRKSTHNQM